MYKRDLITAEIQKLAQVLAKIMGLKIELRLDEADSLFRQTLENDFGLPIDTLKNEDMVPFETWLSEQSLPSEKLDLLSHFIFSELDFNTTIPENAVLAGKLNLIYRTLETKHRLVHLVNLDRQKLIERFL